MFYNLCHEKTSPAIITEDGCFSYGELAKRVLDFSEKLPASRCLIGLVANNDLNTLITYLAALQQKHVILLLDGQREEQELLALVEHYQCQSFIKEGEVTERDSKPIQLDARVALLLSTSGSTGTPKQVALSVDNLQSNAESICQYLSIEKSDTSITTLPFSYSYGLSVVNSHLNAGACIVLNEDSMMSRNFWEKLDKYRVSSFAGVPFQYDMLKRLRLHQKALPNLKYITQAGGKLSDDVVCYLRDYAAERNKRFFVMYGQTEATARMAFNQIDENASVGSIGQPIPNGKFKIVDENGKTILSPHVSGELCYSGPNIMLGYAVNPKDLSSFNQQVWLSTGDMAYFDERGDFFISGRLKRFVKVFGQRINLDDVEQWLNSNDVKCYCIGEDGAIRIGVMKIQQRDYQKDIKSKVSAFLNIHHSKVDVRVFDNLPITSNGKKDYQTLALWFTEGTFVQ